MPIVTFFIAVTMAFSMHASRAVAQETRLRDRPNLAEQTQNYCELWMGVSAFSVENFSTAQEIKSALPGLMNSIASFTKGETDVLEDLADLIHQARLTQLVALTRVPALAGSDGSIDRGRIEVLLDEVGDQLPPYITVGDFDVQDRARDINDGFDHHRSDMTVFNTQITQLLRALNKATTFHTQRINFIADLLRANGRDTSAAEDLMLLEQSIDSLERVKKLVDAALDRAQSLQQTVEETLSGNRRRSPQMGAYIDQLNQGGLPDTAALMALDARIRRRAGERVEFYQQLSNRLGASIATGRAALPLAEERWRRQARNPRPTTP